MVLLRERSIQCVEKSIRGGKKLMGRGLWSSIPLLGMKCSFALALRLENGDQRTTPRFLLDTNQTRFLQILQGLLLNPSGNSKPGEKVLKGKLRIKCYGNQKNHEIAERGLECLSQLNHLAIHIHSRSSLPRIDDITIHKFQADWILIWFSLGSSRFSEEP